MLAVQKDYYDNIDNIVNFPGYNEPWNYKSTRMECLYNDKEVSKLNDVFVRHIQITNIRHNISITRKGVRDFVLYMIDAVDNDVELTGMKGVRFQMIVSYLYDMIFESTWQYIR